VEHPGWWNAPVRIFGERQAWLGIVGLAPGKSGANRTGRAFIGDHAGDTLYQTLSRHGLTRGDYHDGGADGFALEGVAIVNPVRCAPPGNKPLPAEIASCRRFFDPVIAALDGLIVLVALGRVAHQAVLRAGGAAPSAFPFSHLAEHVLPDGHILIDSYHCSRLNTNTGRLTPAMFDQVFLRALAHRRST
jgi:uracil-DNA glycosylase family 4